MDNTINHTGKLKSKAKVYEFHPFFTEKGKFRAGVNYIQCFSQFQLQLFVKIDIQLQL